MVEATERSSATRARAANDAFPMFSDVEMAQRLSRVRSAMARHGVDALLVYGHTGIGTSVGQVNLQYLAGYAAVVETYLVVPQTGEPRCSSPSRSTSRTLATSRTSETSVPVTLSAARSAA